MTSMSPVPRRPQPPSTRPPLPQLAQSPEQTTAAGSRTIACGKNRSRRPNTYSAREKRKIPSCCLYGPIRTREECNHKNSAPETARTKNNSKREKEPSWQAGVAEQIQQQQQGRGNIMRGEQPSTDGIMSSTHCSSPSSSCVSSSRSHVGSCSPSSSRSAQPPPPPSA